EPFLHGRQSSYSFRLVCLTPGASTSMASPASDTSARLPLLAASSSVGTDPQQQGASNGICFPKARPVNSHRPRAAAATPVRTATWISLVSCPRHARCNAKAAAAATPSVASCSLDRASRRRSAQRLRVVVETR
ncbi:hypothetical protein ACJX0J_036920, partial [Zea mays]